MAGYDGRGARFDVVAVEGSDLSFTVTAVDGDAAAVDVSSATITGNVYNRDGAVLDTLNVAVSGVGNNVITLSLSDTEVDALVSPATWSLVVDRAGDARTWLAGSFLVRPPQSARNAATGTAVTATVDTDVVVTADVLTGVGPDAAIAAHNADTTDVHGITDTSALALSLDVTAEIDADIATHAAETDVHGIAAAIDADIAAHSAETDVHGIAAAIDADIAAHVAESDPHTQYAKVAGDTFTGAVVVPAITAANQAAQVTAYDDTTGQLQIGGVEMGDTGWRKVLSWTGGVQDVSDQIGDINLAGGIAINGTGYLAMRRQGNHVTLILPQSSGNTMGVTLSGTRAILTGGTTWASGFGVSPGELRNAFGTVAGVNGRIQPAHFGFYVGANRACLGAPVATNFDYWQITYPTDDPWPATLPGVAP